MTYVLVLTINYEKAILVISIINDLFSDIKHEYIAFIGFFQS